MCAWTVIQEEASIVLVGSFNPKIFHPEWFIRKGIVEPWSYEDDKELIQVQDYAGFCFPDEKRVSVLLDRFSITTPYASEQLSIKDIVQSTFSILSETPLYQLGMNYSATIKLDTNDEWLKFGATLAPKQLWIDAAGYLNDDQMDEAGLWEMTAFLPRPDSLKGCIRPKISVKNIKERELVFLINSHVELEESTRVDSILESHWDDSLTLATKIINNIVKTQLG
ncbi:hypothetical protein [Cellvibrio fontiphilus]|uniref:Uncharacterized protein n=1 Tax=Cellvibrio fontiphilus TaxID=1815559 RepID=A0ABV7FEL0_9GAMM